MALACALIMTCAPVAVADQNKEYNGQVSQALDALVTGDTNSSLTHLKQALEFNSNDPLAHTAIGLAMIMGGRADDAALAFESALKKDASCAEAIYGEGLVKLNKGQLGPAVTDICRAHAANPNLGINVSIDYLKMMAGSVYHSDALETGDCGRSLYAFSLMKQSKRSEAAVIWRELLPSVTRAGFGEPIGCSMTFLPKSPVVYTGWGVKTSYKTIAASNTKLLSVSGNVTLQADLSKAKNVQIVAFYVDSELVGITNQPPFQYAWDTTLAENGVHTVRISGTDSYCYSVCDKTSRVIVRNAGALPPKRAESDEAVKLWSRLWELMRLRPSASAVNYNIALCALKSNDHESAIAALERVMAANPDYLDAADMLAGLYKKSGACYTKLYRGDTTSKRIALTFDDGPKKETLALLNMLKAKGVKATFFVVGKQAECMPEIVKKIQADGHEIQNHTYAHRALGYLSSREIEQEYFKTAAVVRSITGLSTTALRPPGGRTGRNVDEFAKKFGVKLAFWSASCVSLEGTKPGRMSKYAIASAKPGGIILMHNSDGVTAGALSAIIDGLRSKGYSFACLSEMTCQEGKK